MTGGLSCDYDFEPDPGQICWEAPHGFTKCESKRAKCVSCGAKIAIGDNVLLFRRWKCPQHEIELRIYGDERWYGPPRAPWFHCEPCGNIFLFLKDFRYSFDPTENMKVLAEEHANLVKAGQAGCL